MPKRKSTTTTSSSSGSSKQKLGTNDGSENNDVNWALCDECCTWNIVTKDLKGEAFDCTLVGGTCQPAGKELIGWQFQKKFVSYGVWTGEIVHFDSEKDGDAKYVGRYEDGTDEWYTLDEIRNKFKVAKNTKRRGIIVEPWSERSALSPRKPSNDVAKKKSAAGKKRKAAAPTSTSTSTSPNENIMPASKTAKKVSAPAAPVVVPPVVVPPVVVPLVVVPPIVVSEKKKKKNKDGKSLQDAICIDLDTSEDDDDEESSDVVIILSKEQATASSSTTISTTSTSSSSSSSAAKTTITATELGEDEEFQVIKSTGKNPLVDFPHARHTCLVNRWQVTDDASRCSNCYCFVCDDKAAKCPAWSMHCHSFPSYEWKAARAKWKSEAAQRKAGTLPKGGSTTITTSSSSSSSSSQAHPLNPTTRCSCNHPSTSVSASAHQQMFAPMKYTFNTKGQGQYHLQYVNHPLLTRGKMQYKYNARFVCIECKCPPPAALKRRLEVLTFGSTYDEKGKNIMGLPHGSVVGAVGPTDNSACMEKLNLLAKKISDGRTKLEKTLWKHVLNRGGDAGMSNVSDATKELLKLPYAHQLWCKQSDCLYCKNNSSEEELLSTLPIAQPFIDRMGWKTLEFGTLDVRMHLSQKTYFKSTGKPLSSSCHLSWNELAQVERTRYNGGWKGHKAECVQLHDQPSVSQLRYLHARNMLHVPFPEDFGKEGIHTTMSQSTGSFMSFLETCSPRTGTVNNKNNPFYATFEIDWSKENYTERWNSNVLEALTVSQLAAGSAPDPRDRLLARMMEMLLATPGGNQRDTRYHRQDARYSISRPLVFYFEPEKVRLPSTDNPYLQRKGFTNNRERRLYYTKRAEWESKQAARTSVCRSLSVTCKRVIDDRSNPHFQCFEFVMLKNTNPKYKKK